MKHLALIAGAAALIIPGAALAKTTYNNPDQQIRYTSKQATAEGEYRIDVSSEPDFRQLRGNTNSFRTGEGEQLQVDGSSVFKVSADGSRSYAPSGAYKILNDQVIIVRDGQFVRLETAPESVILGMNDETRDNNRR